MTEQWKELKETITEMRDNDGTGTQQEVCKFLVNLMNVLEKQISNSENSNKGNLISRQAVINAIANTCFWLSADNWEELTKCINSIKSVENKGEWIKTKDQYGTYHYTCSKCGNDIATKSDALNENFCSECGADMRKAVKHERFNQQERTLS